MFDLLMFLASTALLGACCYVLGLLQRPAHRVRRVVPLTLAPIGRAEPQEFRNE